MRRCFLLLIDGLRPDVAEAELAAGRLPHLARLVKSGSAGRAITSFPSTTSVSYLPFLTGCTPGHCNIPSIRWLDRSRYDGRWWSSRTAVRSYCGYQAGMLDEDISPEVRTIFELVPESIAIFTMISRGLTPHRNPASVERQFWGALAHYALWHQPSDDAVANHLLQAVEQPARFVFAQFPAVDGYTHQTHPHAERVVRSLHLVDEVVGRLIDRLAARGQLQDTLIVMVSDHGASVVREHFDLAEWFRRQGIPTMAHPVLWQKQPEAAVMVAGNGSAMVYAKPDLSRLERWPMERLRRRDTFGSREDLIELLVSEPAVALVAAEGDGGRVTVADATGEAMLSRVDGRIRYQPGSGDPLRIGGPREGTDREWLAATFDSPMPDAAYQLLDQFRAQRTGDLVVIANEGYDFRARFEVPEHKAGHGSLIRAHMHTPLWANRRLGRTPLRTIDVFPTMLDWLDVPLPDNLDGELVWRL